MGKLFEDESDDLRHIRAEILRYRTSQLMNDRERAVFLGLHETTRIRENAKILCPERFTCGHHVWIGEGAILDAQGGLEIGDYTQIGLYVMVWSHSTHKQALAAETGMSKGKIDYKTTRIGRRCFIAGHSVIAAGVTIGDGVIVAPMSFVDRDLADGEVFSGNHRMRALEREIETLKQEIEKLRDPRG
jgi:UDP-3-O-[3-hydroxymyristoyl] glucosamine N-acyltransferase